MDCRAYTLWISISSIYEAGHVSSSGNRLSPCKSAVVLRTYRGVGL